MPRSPFQGTFQSGIRPTVVTAPDALVFINGEVDIIGCSSCKRKFDFNRYITSIQTDGSVDSPPGSASISLSIPRHTVDDFYFDGVPIISPMMEIEIYAKGYYLVEGLPQYYPIFWGMVTEVNDNYSTGQHTVSLQCADILKWWELCKMNINPAFTAPTGKLGRNIFGNVFFGTNPYDIIWTLAQYSFGDVVVGTGSLTSLNKEQGQPTTFNAALTDIMQYWEKRFSRIRSNMMLYGTNGIAVRGDTLYAKFQQNPNQPSLNLASTAVRNANGGAEAGQMNFDPTSPEVVAFRTQGSQAGQINLWQSEYQTKLELANSAKDAIGYEFYMDVTGDIVFKPPFFNLDVLSNKPLSWIQDIDIIDWDFGESEAEVVTQITMQGGYAGNIDWGFPEELTPYTSVTDYHLLRKYGWRTHPYNSEFLGSPILMFYVGMDVMDRINAKRHRASVTIPCRPELRLGFPVYVAPKDQIWYISGISHNISFGGRAQTTLTLTARREKFKAPSGIGTLKQKSGPKGGINPMSSRQLSKGAASFELKVGDAAQLPPTNTPQPGKPDPYAPLILRHPKTGRICGYPNAVIVYTRPMLQGPEAGAAAGVKPPGTNKVQAAAKAAAAKVREETATEDLGRFTNVAFTKQDRIEDTHTTNRYQYGLNSAGVYVYAHDVDKAINEITLLPAANIDGPLELKKSRVPHASGMIRPVSDERGFEVIGHYRYGRGISLRDGSLILNDGGRNTQANIGVQQALSGGLYETLAAQSQGLSTIVSAYPNPAETIARLSPDGSDLQTAGIENPQTKQPEFVGAKKNLVDAAPLGSPEQKGYPASVEAGQLSRALTIAELAAKEDIPATDPDCACFFRSDLTFISAGYQVKTLNPATPDDATLLNAQASADFANANSTPIKQNLNAPQGTSFITKAERFLYDLYAALDKDHVEYEASLRGANVAKGTFESQTTENILFSSPQDTQGAFSPPFSQPNRGALGTLQGIEDSLQSNAADLKKTFSQFGDKLKANTQRAQLSGEIGTDKSNLAKLTAQRDAIVKAQGGSTVTLGTSPESELASLNDKIAKLAQRIQDNQTSLALLNQKYPP